jgi:hypothetical protein
MKNKLPLAAYYIGVSVLLVSCQVKLPSKRTPEPTHYGQVDNSPVVNGFPKNQFRGLPYPTDPEIPHISIKAMKNPIRKLNF